MDIKIYHPGEIPTGVEAFTRYNDKLEKYAYKNSTSEKYKESPLTDAPVNTLEVIGGKVVKFMLTAKGSDAFAPEYGANLTLYNFINKSLAARIKFDISRDIFRCAEYIKGTEKSLPINSEKLLAIIFLEFRYSMDIRTRFDVYLEIRTTKKHIALLNVPIELGGSN